ncbi:MAG: hypothetical protein ABIY55_31045 [Kofleriaceae bacterium]
MSAEISQAAFARFIEALHHPRDAAVRSAAVSEDVQIHRHAPGARGAITAIAESFTGSLEVARWLARTPPVVRFALVGAAAPAEDLWLVEYAIDAGEFHNGGLWRARLAADGRIAFLSHHPFALPADR